MTNQCKRFHCSAAFNCIESNAHDRWIPVQATNPKYRARAQWNGARDRNRIEDAVTKHQFDHERLDVDRPSIEYVANACDFSRSLNGQKTSGSDYEHEHRDAEHEHEEELRQTNSNVFLEWSNLTYNKSNAHARWIPAQATNPKYRTRAQWNGARDRNRIEDAMTKH
jgi:hypothetical protein